MSNDDEARRKLEVAGWESEDVEGDETIWRNPWDGKWYEEKRAIVLLKGGEDVGTSD